MVRRLGMLLVGAVLVSAGQAAPARAAGTRYFVDCAHGNDASSGLSPANAWRSLGKVSSTAFQPGDTILLRRGTRCDGVLAPTGSGAPGAPIEVAAYGSGPKPSIAGGGARAAVFLHNVDEWELHDLDVTDHGQPPQPGQKRTGIYVLLDRFGVGHHFVVTGVDIHDVDTAPTPPAGSTDLENYTKDAGGIIFDAASGNGFDDVSLAGNALRNVAREGIFVQGSLATTGLVVRGNRLDGIGGDGIVAVGSSGALVERNVVRGFNTAGTSFNAGVWAYASADAVFQFNDVSHGQHGPLDSMAYDIDGSNRHLVFQYNLSHDNSGGFLMLCNNVAPLSAGAPNGGSVVRYNISQDDYATVRGVIDAPSACASESDISIYNNTVYTKDPRVTTLVENTNGSSMRVMNNILVGPSPQALIYDQSGTWEHDLYLDVTCAARPPDAHAVIADPRFVAPGTATSLDTAGGYRLRAGSPALAAGTPVADNGGRDYFGDPVPPGAPPNIGAYEGPGVPGTSPGIPLPASAPGC